LPDFFGLRWQAQRDTALLSCASPAFAHRLTLSLLEDKPPREKRRRRCALSPYFGDIYLMGL
jgi:hypothetical protein